jgi:hypothetical protein
LRNRTTVLLAAFALQAAAGPVEFGRTELDRAISARGLRPGAVRFKTEVSAGAPESFRIMPGLISGADLRGLMYGLLEAAAQIRETGRLVRTSGAPATPIRGIRYLLHNRDLENDWYFSREYWNDFFAMLARNRFNRFNLVFAHQTDYLAPPYPYWVTVEEFPQVRVPGLSNAERERNLEMLCYISQTAADHAVDFTLGVWEHNVQRGMKPTVEGLTPENIGPYSYAALRKVLAACPAIRSVQMRTNSESGIPDVQQVEFYRDHIFRAIHDAGRRVTLDLRAWALAGNMLEAAKAADVPLRVSSKYWAEDLGRPYQPAETFANYSYMNLLEKPRPYDFYWEIWALGSHRLLLWGDPDFVRRAVPTFTLAGAAGFEIDPPLAQKGFGNRPGKWGVFTEAQKDRAFWRWEFERYWMYYLLWGRLSYDPKAPEKIWTSELKKRFGAAAPDVLAAYQAASGVVNEIVAAHMADPNMYIWPEINPGGLLDAYINVKPSDWRYVASIPEAVRNRLEGIASAKQTPQDTAELLRGRAVKIEAAIAKVRAKMPEGNREWRSTEPDFEVLALLARYHAHKQIAAFETAWFDQTSDGAALETAHREIAAAIPVWEKLAALTDDLYPAQMAFGPDDIGHWKDKLPYVRHDLKLIEERRKVLEQFGRFDFGFDFGGRSAVAPRFKLVAPETNYTEAVGYGWVSEGERRAQALPATPYLEMRAVARNPKSLPENLLYGDSIQGRGAQTFRIRAAAGEYTVFFLSPEGTGAPKQLQVQNGYLDVVFPEGEWTVSGLVVKRPVGQASRPVIEKPKPPARPGIRHVPPKTAIPGRVLDLSLLITPTTPVKAVRLHYRPVNQLAEFKVIENAGAKGAFTIPAQDVSGRWDLMYYFEILNRDGSGWFQPDPGVATPYYVVPVTSMEAK